MKQRARGSMYRAWCDEGERSDVGLWQHRLQARRGQQVAWHPIVGCAVLAYPLLCAAPLLAEPLAASGQQPIRRDAQSVELTPEQLLELADRLVAARRFDEARPLVKALEQVPSHAMERIFLEGYIAVETGDLETAVRKFRRVLALRPDITRARLELARALQMQGKDKAADHHYRLAQEDKALPPEIAKTVYASRALIRERRVWDLSVALGLAPDTNINSATRDRTIDINLGGQTLPVELDADARKKTGVGRTASATGSARRALGGQHMLVLEADAHAVNYAGSDADDISLQVALGPERAFRDGLIASLSAVYLHRWYGGDVATRGYGGRVALQKALNASARVGSQLDLRQLDSERTALQDGTQLLARVTFERVVFRTFLFSASVFARREWLRSDGYSSSELGVLAGAGGELPFGINAGASASISRAGFDEPIPVLGAEARKDWRVGARLYAGVRAIRVAGFSPSVSYSFASALSNIDLYDFDRHRVEFQLTRYF